MRILLINVPHPAIGSRIPDDHLPPLGLLSIGGPLIDDGHDVRLLDGEFGPAPTASSRGAGETVRAGCRAVRPFRLDLRPSGDRRGRARDRGRDAAREDRLWRRFPHLSLARDPRRRAVRDRDRARGGRGDRAAADARARTRPAARRHRRHRVSRRRRRVRDQARAGDPRSRRLSRRLGADRPRALQLLGRPARGRGAVLARLPASVQLLRPARLLDPLAPPRSGAASPKSSRGCIASTA